MPLAKGPSATDAVGRLGRRISVARCAVGPFARQRLADSLGRRPNNALECHLFLWTAVAEVP